MDEEDCTLYIKCGNIFWTKNIYAALKILLKNLNVKFKENEKFKILEIQLEEDYIFYVRILNLKNVNFDFIKIKYFITSDEIMNYAQKTNDDKALYNYIFGNFIKGLN